MVMWTAGDCCGSVVVVLYCIACCVSVCTIKQEESESRIDYHKKQ